MFDSLCYRIVYEDSSVINIGWYQICDQTFSTLKAAKEARKLYLEKYPECDSKRIFIRKETVQIMKL